MDEQTRDKWFAEASDIEAPLEASTILKRALPVAASTIVGLLDDEDASTRIRFEAAKFVIDHGLGKEATDGGNPWDAFLEDVRLDAEAEDEA
jgi:hypothetical protein